MNVHDLANIENIFNLIGIGLEIIGFVILLSGFREWYVKNKGLDTEKEKRIEKIFVNMEKIRASQEELKINSILTKEYIEGLKDENLAMIPKMRSKYFKKIEYVGIPLVILGLFFQALSIIHHA